MLCPLGKRVAGTQLSEQKKTRPVSSTSKHEVRQINNILTHIGTMAILDQKKSNI